MAATKQTKNEQARIAFYDLCKAHGIEVDYTPGGIVKGAKVPFLIMMDAPSGKLWKGLDTHCNGEIQGLEGTTKTDWLDNLRILSELLAKGWDECTDPSCDVCHPEE